MNKAQLQLEAVQEMNEVLKGFIEKYTGEGKLGKLELVLPFKEKLKLLEKPSEPAMQGEIRNLLAFEPLEEDAQNEDLIFEPKWLKRGGAAVLVSVSGSGKSVLSLQLAISWGAGKEIFGMKPTRPLKIAVFQTEDDYDEVCEFRASMEKGYKETLGWTDAEWRSAAANVDFVTMHGERDKEFLERLVKIQLMAIRTTGKAYDLVIMNPLMAFVTDPSDNAKLVEFTRAGLDPIITGNHLDLPVKTALFIIHHTTKPPNVNARGGFGTDQYAQYAGIGGADLTNWLRAVFTLMPDGKNSGRYKLVAAKKGKRMRWPVPKGEQMPMKFLWQYDNSKDPKAKEFMFWSEEGAEAPAEERDIAADAERLAEEVRNKVMTKTELTRTAEGKFGSRNYGREVLKYLNDNLEEFGIQIMAGDRNKSYYIAK